MGSHLAQKPRGINEVMTMMAINVQPRNFCEFWNFCEYL